jgi:hypothetical protein
MAKCAHCNKTLFINRFRDGDNQYCSVVCLTANKTGFFCEKCVNETTDKAPGNTYLVNFIGTHLRGGSSRCSTCHSVIQTKTFMLIPFG